MSLQLLCCFFEKRDDHDVALFRSSDSDTASDISARKPRDYPDIGTLDPLSTDKTSFVLEVGVIFGCGAEPGPFSKTMFNGGCSLQIDDETEEDLMTVLLDPPFPPGVFIVTTEVRRMSGRGRIWSGSGSGSGAGSGSGKGKFANCFFLH